MRNTLSPGSRNSQQTATWTAGLTKQATYSSPYPPPQAGRTPRPSSSRAIPTWSARRTAGSSDFSKDPIKAVVENGWLIAKDTTLGADCGIGIAAQLAVLEDKELPHGRIECLFTTSEETGLDGAFALKPDFLTGSILLNLDSEDEGELFIGCAGGIDTTASASRPDSAAASADTAGTT